MKTAKSKCLVLALLVASLPAWAEGARHYRAGWALLGGFFLVYYFIEVAAVRRVTERAWISCLLLGVFAAAALPLLVFGAPLAGQLMGADWGRPPVISSSGLTFVTPLKLFSTPFWLTVVTAAGLLGMLKFVFLKPFSVGSTGVGNVLGMLSAVLISTTVFFSSLLFEPKRAVASLQETVTSAVKGEIESQKSGRGDGGAVGDAARKLTDPLRKHYEGLGRQVRDLERK